MTARTPEWRWTQKLLSQVRSETGAMKLVWRICAACGEVVLGGGLVAEDAVGEVGDVEAGEGVDGVGRAARDACRCRRDRRRRCRRRRLRGCGGRRRRHGELFGVTGDEEEAVACGGPDAAGGFGDAGGGAEDEDLLRDGGPAGANGKSFAVGGGGDGAGRWSVRDVGAGEGIRGVRGCGHSEVGSPVTRSQKQEVICGSR